MAGAFCQAMMPTAIENLEHGNMGPRRMPCRTREQAAELLEALRAAYQSLSIEGRRQVKADIAELGRVHLSKRAR
jgi:hypothetical protein